MPLIPPTMLAIRLHGPRDLRCEQVPRPGDPGPGQVRITVTAVGICGSDLHTYEDARIGDTCVEQPLILGHEFAGVVEAAGTDAVDGTGQPLHVGQRVAVDPAQPCGRCELCRTGHPNLCPDHRFCGVAPTDGAMCESLIVPADACFPVPDDFTDEQAAMLEPLGVALHAIDLAHIHVGHSVAVIGAGPIGLLCIQVARLAGAARVFVAEPLPHRMALAQQLGAIPLTDSTATHASGGTSGGTSGGVDVAIEAAWSDESALAAAVAALRPGGRLVIVGIASNDRLTFPHSPARRKGLTIALSRRMKHTYPRAIAMVASGQIDLTTFISHRLPLNDAAQGFHLAHTRTDGASKVILGSFTPQ